MTPERLADLRGRVARSELGCGPSSAVLVAELLADHERLLAEPPSVVEQQLRGLAADELDAGMVRLVEAQGELMSAIANPSARAKCNSTRSAIGSMAEALRSLSKAHAFEVAADEVTGAFKDGVQQ